MGQYITAESGLGGSGLKKIRHKCLCHIEMGVRRQQWIAEAPNVGELAPWISDCTPAPQQDTVGVAERSTSKLHFHCGLASHRHRMKYLSFLTSWGLRDRLVRFVKMGKGLVNRLVNLQGD